MPERVHRPGELPHLALRTLRSLRKPTIDADQEQQLTSRLTPTELLLYRSMRQHDRAHAVRSAHAVRDLGADVMVASAMHDVGKVDAGLGTVGRIIATVAGMTMPRVAHGWAHHTDFRGQITRYLEHPERGAAALRDAGASALAIEWARSHHLPPTDAAVDAETLRRLREADAS